MIDKLAIKYKLWPLLERTFNRKFDYSLNVTRQDTSEWDSLNHINLMFEIENEFKCMLSADDIAQLYSSSDNIIAFLERNLDA